MTCKNFSQNFTTISQQYCFCTLGSCMNKALRIYPCSTLTNLLTKTPSGPTSGFMRLFIVFCTDEVFTIIFTWKEEYVLNLVFRLSQLISSNPDSESASFTQSTTSSAGVSWWSLETKMFTADFRTGVDFSLLFVVGMYRIRFFTGYRIPDTSGYQISPDTE